MRGKQEMLERVFVPLGKLHHISPRILEGGGRRGRKEKKSDLSFNGQLMMSYHYTQILWSPKKTQLICVLIGWPAPRGGGCLFFPLLLFLSLLLLY